MINLQVIMAGIEAAISAAPKVAAVAQKGKELISSLFSAGVITATRQDALHKRVDTVQADFLAGRVPAALVVEPDPT